MYEWVIILDDQVYKLVCFFKGQVYEWGKFRNAGSHTRTTFTPKLPPPPREILYVLRDELNKQNAFVQNPNEYCMYAWLYCDFEEIKHVETKTAVV